MNSKLIANVSGYAPVPQLVLRLWRADPTKAWVRRHHGTASKTSLEPGCFRVWFQVNLGKKLKVGKSTEWGIPVVVV